MSKHHIRGFTMIELMITMGIAAILVGLSVPGFMRLTRGSQMTAVANDLLIAIHTARAEAVKRQVRTAFCFSAAPDAATPACDGNGRQGWIVFADDADATVAAATDGNLVVDAGEQVILRRSEVPSTMTVNNSSGIFVAFLPSGFTDPSGTPLSSLVLCDQRGVSGARALEVGVIGRPRIVRSAAEITSTFGGCP